ncbi:acetyltransferase [Trichoderma arundinaceum]|uniref:Acetyltransferase n=1 Tax=Trichoderma arundinaceum TaxID=490622 RepID=A0A395N821_TRIAR|nr:acetyltransferase [Trichoderma arundinaceum]
MGQRQQPDISPVLVRQATSPTDISSIIECFKVYTAWLDEDLTHQNYDDELKGLPGKYASPAGALLIAVDAATDSVLGCIALRPLNLEPVFLESRPSGLRYCEIKRLFVYPEARGRRVAKTLLVEAVKCAQAGGYDEMLLDTLSRMTAAIGLYKSEGFVETEPYNSSPLQGTMYFGKRLLSDYRIFLLRASLPKPAPRPARSGFEARDLVPPHSPKGHRPDQRGQEAVSRLLLLQPIVLAGPA